MNNVLERMSKVLKGMREATKDPSKDCRSPGLGLKTGPPEFKA